MDEPALVGRVTSALTSFSGSSDEVNGCVGNGATRECSRSTGVHTPPGPGEYYDPTGGTDYGVCFLTKVSGSFQNSADFVEIRKAAGQWVVVTRWAFASNEPFFWSAACIHQSELHNFSGFFSTEPTEVRCTSTPVEQAVLPSPGVEAFCPWTKMGGTFQSVDRPRHSSGAIPETPMAGRTTVRAECDTAQRGSTIIRSATYCSRTAQPMHRGAEVLLDFETGELNDYLDPTEDAFCYLSEVGGFPRDGYAEVYPDPMSGRYRVVRNSPDVRVRASCILRWQ